MSNTTENNKIIKTEEIDLVDIFKKIWEGRKTIYKSIGGAIVLGLIIVIGTPKEYKSEITLLVESASNTSGMSGLLQQFGGLAGLNLNNPAGEDALTPDLYPEVIKSTPFLLEVMDKKVTDAKYNSTLKVSEFLERHTHSSLLSTIKDYTIGLPFKIIKWIKGKPKETDTKNQNDNGPLKLTQVQFDLAEALSDRIKVGEGESENTLTISIEMQDPLTSALLADSVVKCLTKYIIDYRTQKAKVDLKFVEDRHAEAEERYKKAQQTLANFQDQNQNMILASAKTTEQKLQAEYTLAFNVYNGLSQQLEQAKIKVQEKTPVFKVINPATVPLKKSKPKTSIILIAMVFLGGFTGIGIIFGKILLKNFKKKL
jgi:uncharacterized protein involved in exopolysaccharide biosynthesis